MRRIFLLAFCMAVAPALAETPGPEPTPAEQRAVQKYGVDHPDCFAWTDGCMICTQKTCSTPGIACTPHEPVCEARAEKLEAPKPDTSPVAPPAEKP
ncbi:hypothetical protein GGD83_000977 [Rhodoblastus sphagnicola]|nr:hypothetical protein [Rhodoblastus sphagnicola]MBB4197191.1 hypothetical protein [Rhodoblastus sphagnicola]